MIVYKTQINGCVGPCVYKERWDLVFELADMIDETSIGDTFTVEIAEMTQEEFDNLSEFEGY